MAGFPGLLTVLGGLLTVPDSEDDIFPPWALILAPIESVWDSLLALFPPSFLALLELYWGYRGGCMGVY